jgi:hypothetical protein
MMDEDINICADPMFLICKFNGSLESTKEEYKIIAANVVSSPNEKRLTYKQIELKAKFEKDLRQIVDIYGVILEIIMLKDEALTFRFSQRNSFNRKFTLSKAKIKRNQRYFYRILHLWKNWTNVSKNYLGHN